MDGCLFVRVCVCVCVSVCVRSSTPCSDLASLSIKRVIRFANIIILVKLNVGRIPEKVSYCHDNVVTNHCSDQLLAYRYLRLPELNLTWKLVIRKLAECDRLCVCVCVCMCVLACTSACQCLCICKCV